MKKILLSLFFVLWLSGMSCGMESVDVSEYVRRDVFEARMDRLEAVLEKNLIQLRGDISARFAGVDLRFNQLGSKIEVMNTRLDAMDARISDLQMFVTWGFAIIGFFIAFAAFIPSIGEMFRRLRRPSVTLEQVEELINAKLEGIRRT